MADDADGGIDKKGILSSIEQASVRTPAPAAAPAAYVSHDRPPSASRRGIPIPVPASPWDRHRSEIAAIVSAFVGMIWLSVGLGLRAWAPCMIGIGFSGAALAVWALEVWSGD